MFILNFAYRFYHDEADFATINNRIRRGDIIGAKGTPSKDIPCRFLLLVRQSSYYSTNKERRIKSYTERTNYSDTNTSSITKFIFWS